MDNTQLISAGAVIVLLHIIINIHLSKEILQWMPSPIKRILLLACVWLVPFIGIVFTYKTLNLDWFEKNSKKTSSGQNHVSGAFLEIDSIFNPSQKYVIAEQQKENIEQKEDGKMYEKEKTDLSKIEPKNVSRS